MVVGDHLSGSCCTQYGSPILFRTFTWTVNEMADSLAWNKISHVAAFFHSLRGFVTKQYKAHWPFLRIKGIIRFIPCFLYFSSSILGKLDNFLQIIIEESNASFFCLSGCQYG